ncbi:DUF3263 domain-containing protein [Corynebacterium uropygiale]|uniref:DUF3263 domain-containing protein n=1 Tax=Corynebacterium uropygiale TaxID=1775911 RepID=A0A9X1QQG3_9CORY|nr:DUF3263 domain-containing protein [Corynebacterium uropygiale]MCF4007241.1 DUF3263 domain-containing protein [Corynebacterium uropygiale]
MRELREDERRILEFELQAPRQRGAKEEAIRRSLGMSPVRYHQRLNQLVDDPAALAAYPLVVGRLRRIRDRLR